jgi:hypothetical protein
LFQVSLTLIARSFYEEKAGMVRGVLAKQIIEDANTNRSSVYRWLRANYTEVAKAIPVRGSWDALRRAAIEAEITTRKGIPTVAALRSAWLRVVADMERAGGRAVRNSGKAPTATSQPAAPSRRRAKRQPIATQIVGTPGSDDHDHEQPPKFTFHPTKLR